MKTRVSVRVPASSGNLGPGFDVLGLALDLHNELHVRVLSSKPGRPVIAIEGEGAATLPRDERNAVYKTIQWGFRKLGKKTPSLSLHCVNRIPLARGLGSSSAAYLSALLAANALAGNKADRDQILSWATELEGHPDNVAPALFGGVRASGVLNGKVVSFSLPVPKSRFIVAVPAFELSTKKARAVLPYKVRLQDAVFNLSAVALMPFAFKNNLELLSEILNDRLHEPYRSKLVPGFHRVKQAALNAGALGVTLSGAGPTMLSLSPASRVSRVSNAMKSAFQSAGVRCEIKDLKINTRGAVVK